MTASTYEKFLNVAYKRFLTHGEPGINIQAIAKEVGKTKGAFYKPGISRKVLLVDVLKHGNDQIRQYHAKLREMKTIAEYKKIIKECEDAASFARQMMLLVVSETTAPQSEEFMKLLPLSAQEAARLLTDDKKKQSRLLPLIGSLAQVFLANFENKSFDERLDSYIASLKQIKIP